MRFRLVLVGALVVAVAAAVSLSVNPLANGLTVRHGTAVAAGIHKIKHGAAAAVGINEIAGGIHKIKHVIIIEQENRSFDSYFGTYPGADGIPSGVCLPDPLRGGCVRPYVDHSDSDAGLYLLHDNAASVADINGGKMNGFVRDSEYEGRCKTPKGALVPASQASAAAANPSANPNGASAARSCGLVPMGYHVGSDIPNYWAYARHFGLQDHMFESVDSWSFPAHLELVSAWSARCKSSTDPMSCVSSTKPANRTAKRPTPFAWTDLTWLLHSHHVSWGYYLDNGATFTTNAYAGVPTIWNPLPGFTDVGQDAQEGNVQNLTHFFAQAQAGTLPAVSWVIPEPADSEHPPARISRGMAFTTSVINAVMQSKDWSSSAIFLSWDDWGGFYDHVVPPKIDQLGYGIRVPSLIISPYAKPGYIDHQVVSTDSYLKFIEDDFLGGARLNPATDGRPDSRPDVRENLAGDLTSAFNFNQKPLPPLILPACPKTTLVPAPPPGCDGNVLLDFKSWGDS